MFFNSYYIVKKKGGSDTTKHFTIEDNEFGKEES